MKKLSVLLALLIVLSILPVSALAAESDYAQTLFDHSKLLEIDIQMDDEAWDNMIATAADEEYSACDLMVNGVLYENVAIRPKGNSSMSTVTRRGSERYSWRIKFDKYEKGRTCDGLDILILNNGFNDPGNLNEAIAYDMYAFLDADASLCNYAIVYHNGEYFGVYLALEGVDESFAERNYGEDYGELYKPELAGMGNNNKNNDNDDDEGFGASSGNRSNDAASGEASDETADAAAEPVQAVAAEDVSAEPELPEETEEDAAEPELAEEAEEDAAEPELAEEAEEDAAEPELPEEAEEDAAEPELAEEAEEDAAEPELAEETEEASAEPAADEGEQASGESRRSRRASGEQDGEASSEPRAAGGGGGGFGGSNGGALALNYVGDDLESYQGIWDSAKFKSDEEDYARVVEAIKHVCQSDDIESYIDVENVLKYFAIQTFIYNRDGLSGSVAHNYYLYEQDGKLYLIPWDLNESFAMSGDGSAYVNFPIDTPFTVNDLSQRSFFMALLGDEDLLAQYHEYLRQLSEEYVQGGVLAETMERIHSQVDELEESDPTKFFEYSEFTAKADRLMTAIELRAESVLGQLSGEIPSTRDGQTAEPDKLLDTSDSGLSSSSSGEMNR